MLRCREIGAVDMMSYLVSPEHAAEVAKKPRESRVGYLGTRGSAREQKGEGPPPGPRSYTTEEYVKLLDEVGVDKALICTNKMWEYYDQKPSRNFYYEEEDVYEWVKGAPGRMYGLAGYNPMRIVESVAKIEKAVKEWDFKGVYIHSYGYGLRVDDRKYYPLYETCASLGVPVSMQMGHSAEIMPSELGRPMALDWIAIDFPELSLVGSHTGWPWWDELIAMAMKHLNVYMDISAWPPGWWEPSLVRFMDGAIRNKTLWGSNAAIDQAGARFDQMDDMLKDKSKVAIIRENAMRVYKL